MKKLTELLEIGEKLSLELTSDKDVITSVSKFYNNNLHQLNSLIDRKYIYCWDNYIEIIIESDLKKLRDRLKRLKL